MTRDELQRVRDWADERVTGRRAVRAWRLSPQRRAQTVSGISPTASRSIRCEPAMMNRYNEREGLNADAC